jgi:hypothetical protein
MKNTLFTVLLLMMYVSLNAQPHIACNFGIKAGAQVAKLGQPDINWDSRYTWHAGLLAHMHISDHFAIQPELLYSPQGGEHITTLSETELELSYLNLPVVFQYMTNSGFRFQAGPQIGLLLKAKRIINGVESDFKDSFKKADLGVLAGFSYVTKIGVGFDARYVYGLTDIAKKGSSLRLGGKVNNLVIQVGAFYQFKGK